MTKTPLRITPGGVAGTLLALLAAAVCVRLGFWQLDRLEQRVERNRLIEERLAAPTLAVARADLDTAGLAYRRVEILGEYDHARAFVLAGRAHQGAPGVHVVTPLRLAGGGGAVLVVRGWLPSADAAHVDLSPYRTAGPVRIEGMALPFFAADPGGGAGRGGGRPDARPISVDDAAEDGSARVWFRPDAGDVRASLPYPVADFLVQALPADDAPERPVRLPPPELDRGPHLGYAIQWFGFATVALVGWIVMVLRRDRAGARARARPTAR